MNQNFLIPALRMVVLQIADKLVAPGFQGGRGASFAQISGLVDFAIGAGNQLAGRLALCEGPDH